MLSEEIKVIKEIFTNYFGNGKYFCLFFGALIVLFVEEKRKKNRNLLVYYPILTLIIIMNPVAVYVILKLVGRNVYYRFFWLLPVGTVIAYTCTSLISKLDKKKMQIIVGSLMVIIVIFSGKCVYNEIMFGTVNNWYKVPDEYYEIIQIIQQMPIENKKVVTTTDMVAYIRQVDPSIKLAFARRPKGDFNIYEIVGYYELGDLWNLTRVCKEQNINIVVYDNLIKFINPPSDYGYGLYAKTEKYDIYVLENN